MPSNLWESYMNDENLRKRFPLSKRWVLSKIIPWIVGVLLVLYLVSLADAKINSEISRMVFLGSFYLALVVLAVGLAYFLLFYLTLEYEIIGDEVILTRGILVKRSVGIPISKINAIYTTRSLPEIIWGLATFELAVPGNMPRELTRMPGFSKSGADALKKYILDNN